MADIPTVQVFNTSGSETASKEVTTDSSEFGIDVRDDGRVAWATESSGSPTVHESNASLVEQRTTTPNTPAHYGLIAEANDGSEVSVTHNPGSQIDLRTYDWSDTQQGSVKLSDTPYSIGDLTLGYDPFGDIVVSGPESTTWSGAGGDNASSWKVDTTSFTLTGFEFVDGDGFSYSLPTVNVIESTRQVSLVAVCNGDIKIVRDGTLSTPTNGSGALSTLPYTVSTAFLFGKVYFVDGTDFKVLDLSTDSVSDVTADEGTAPSGGRLLARYRGRLVVSGKRTDPHNWFMSAVNDPLDWDFSPTTPTTTQAVAGNLSEAGEIGDVVTALCAYSDDFLIIGCDKSIWMIANDPAAGGIADLITDKVGMAWGASWTKDPFGLMYFVGNDGIYRMAPGSKPESITIGRLDAEFQNVDLATRRALLEWDSQRRGLVLTFATGFENAPQTSYFYDARADAWCDERYGGAIGPSAMLSIDSEEVGETALLLGGKDGYLRHFVDNDDGDDGLDIESKFRYPPIQPRDLDSEYLVVGIRATLAQNSDSATVKIYTGQSAQECWESDTPSVTRTLSAGSNQLYLPRIKGMYTQVEVTKTGTARWALENMAVRVIPAGLRRKPMR